MQPTLRKPFGVIAIIAGLFVYLLLIGQLSGPIGELHVLLQGVIYLILGVVWILPLKPLLQWMETGTWKPPVA